MKTTKKITYFDNQGPKNTKNCVDIAIERATELGLKTIVVASSSGTTAQEFFRKISIKNIHLVILTHAFGFSSPDVWDFDATLADKLRSSGHRIVCGIHALSGLERALSRAPRIGGGSRTEAIVESFRRTLSVGLKVAVECVLIAADQGAISLNTEVVAVGGTENGADTVLVIKPANTASFFDLQVREIVAMPGNR